MTESSKKHEDQENEALWRLCCALVELWDISLDKEIQSDKSTPQTKISKILAKRWMKDLEKAS